MTSLSIDKQKYDCRDESELERKLEREGFSIFNWSDRPGAYYSPHSHGHDEFIIVYKGSITFIIQGSKYKLEPGDLLNLPAGTVHEAVNDTREPVHYFICTRS
jgi:quercetin dioxygenase-like cupin family protein